MVKTGVIQPYRNYLAISIDELPMCGTHCENDRLPYSPTLCQRRAGEWWEKFTILRSTGRSPGAPLHVRSGPQFLVGLGLASVALSLAVLGCQ